MLPASTIRLAPLAGEYGHICRWIWLALPEDAQQETAIALWQHPRITPRALEAVIRYRLQRLRHEVWDRTPTRTPKNPSSLRPSKLAVSTGYRTNSARHSSARMTLTAEQRRGIARKGSTARWNAELSFNR